MASWYENNKVTDGIVKVKLFRLVFSKIAIQHIPDFSIFIDTIDGSNKRL